MEDRCAVTDLIVEQCDHCQRRPNAIDLHQRGGTSSGSGYAQEIVATIYLEGLSYGLLASGGTVYTFGSGHGLHHRRDCSEGVDTPDDRVQELDDPNGDLWRIVAEPRSDVAAGRKLVNIAGGRITKVCGLCALRPQVT